MTRTIVLCLLLASCNSGGRVNQLTIRTGYQVAVIGDTLYVTEPVDVHEPDVSKREQSFVPMGTALKQWAGELPVNSVLVESGYDKVVYRAIVRVHILSIDEMHQRCGSRAAGCTNVDSGDIYVTHELNDSGWGHELSHAIFGAWHS